MPTAQSLAQLLKHDPEKQEELPQLGLVTTAVPNKTPGATASHKIAPGFARGTLVVCVVSGNPG